MTTTSARGFIIDVIAMYRKHPCLWQVTSEEYRNKDERNRALDDILELFKTKDPHANRETVQKKLSSIRGSYNKELGKVNFKWRAMYMAIGVFYNFARRVTAFINNLFHF